MFRKNFLTYILFCLLLLIGCSSMASKNKFYIPITASLQNQDYSSAVQSIENAYNDNQYGRKERLLYYLDAGLAHHYAANYDSSNILLELAEQAEEVLFTKSVTRAAASLLLNDNMLEYAGEDYEVVYVNLIKALNYIALDDFDGAFVEIRRVNEKLALLESKYVGLADQYRNPAGDDTLDINSKIDYQVAEVQFNSDAFARYLSMHMYAAEGLYDDAEIDRQLLEIAFSSQSQIYNFATPDVKHTPENKDYSILSVVAMTGLSPVKEAVNFRLRTDSQLNLVQVLYSDGPNKDDEYSHLALPIAEDFYFKFSLPQMTPRESEVYKIVVKSDSEYVGELQLIDDLAAIATDTFEAKKSVIYFRSIARSLAKGLAAHRAKKKIDSKSGGGLGGWLLKAAVDVGTDIIENADLRSAHLLPGKIYVGDFELVPGKYNLEIEFYDSYDQLLGVSYIEGTDITKNSFNLIQTVNLN